MQRIHDKGRRPVVLQAWNKCSVLKRIRVYYMYISLQFSSVVCNYGLFQLIFRARSFGINLE